MRTSHVIAAMGASLVLLLDSFGNAQPPSFNWARRVAGTINTDFERAIGLAIDNAANVYVTGWFDGTNVSKEQYSVVGLPARFLDFQLVKPEKV